MNRPGLRIAAGVALVAVGLLLVSIALLVGGASRLVPGQATERFVFTVVVTLTAACGTLTAGVGLLRQARPGAWRRWLWAGFTLFVVVALTLLSLVPTG